MDAKHFPRSPAALTGERETLTMTPEQLVASGKMRLGMKKAEEMKRKHEKERRKKQREKKLEKKQ